MDNKKYLLNGEPVSARQLIEEATWIDDRFAQDWLKSTSEAASILRADGRTVESLDQPDESQE